MTQRAVLFDFGGVLARNDLAQQDRIGAKYGFEPGGLMRLFRRIELSPRLQSGASNDAVWNTEFRAGVRAALGEGRAEALFADLRGIHPGLHQPNIDLARALSDGGVKIGIVSNAASDLERTLPERIGVALPWDAVIVSGAVGVAKPQPAIFELAAERIGAALDACFFIDDYGVHVRAAQALGMMGHHFRDDYAALQADLRAQGFAW